MRNAKIGIVLGLLLLMGCAAPNTAQFPNATNITSIQKLMQFDNTITGGMFGIVLLIALWFVSFLGLGLYPKERSIMVASFITFLASILLAVIGIIDGRVSVLMLLMVFASVFFLKGESG